MKREYWLVIVVLLAICALGGYQYVQAQIAAGKLGPSDVG